MLDSIMRLMGKGAILDKSEDPFTQDTSYRCRVKGKLVSTLVVTHNDMLSPDFGNSKVKEWAEMLIPEVERIINEQAESE